MSRAQYAALLEIAEYGERYAVNALNVTARTLDGLVSRGWVAMQMGVAVVTDAGWLAIEADQAVTRAVDAERSAEKPLAIGYAA